MESTQIEREQLVDWRAAIVAGLVAGVVFLLIEMIGQAMLSGSAWVFPRYAAAIVMGTDVLTTGGFDFAVVAVGILVHFVLSVLFALVVAAIIHEWELLVGLIVGALFGLALYAINYYTLTRFFPWFFPVDNWLNIAAHVLFGLTAGGVYEMLEIERYVNVDVQTTIDE